MKRGPGIQLAHQIESNGLFRDGTVQIRRARFDFQSGRPVGAAVGNVLLQGVKPPQLLFSDWNFIQKRRADSVHEAFDAPWRGFTVFLPLRFAPIEKSR